MNQGRFWVQAKHRPRRSSHLRMTTLEMAPSWWQRSARDVVQALRRGEVNTEELLESLERRLRTPEVAALRLVEAECFGRARSIHGKGDGAPGDLHGLPVMAKATHAVEGVPFSLGLLRNAGRLAAGNDPLVQHIESKRGGVVYATSNAPALAMGGHTFNAVVGGTRNPHDPERSAGGSSGGSAAALAVGAAWLAMGSDLAGSCRTPASFCGIVGMRPSPGVVPKAVSKQELGEEENSNTLRFENGPLARDIEDLALFLDAMDPNVITEEESYQQAAHAPERKWRVAWTADFGGTAPVDPAVAHLCEQAATLLADGNLTHNAPDVSDAPRIHFLLRAHLLSNRHGNLVEEGMADLPEETLWQLKRGQLVPKSEVDWARRAKAAYAKRFDDFMQGQDIMACPAAPVPPFPAQERWVRHVNDTKMSSYVEWLRHAYVISLADVPAISLPCGWTSDGLPVGIQLVARRGQDRFLISAAASLQRKVQQHLEATGQKTFGSVLEHLKDAQHINKLPPMPKL